MINEYIDSLINSIIDKISNEINNQTFNSIVGNDLNYHLDPKYRSSFFQEYYFKVTGNIDNFLTDPRFFRHFKYQYAIQGADNNLLNRLEANKQVILDYVKSERLFQLYHQFFSAVDTKFGSRNIRKDFGSFFTKVVHTLRPDAYCALDNPEKKYFNLEKESFYISFYIMSQAYKNWCIRNSQMVSSLKVSFKEIDKDNVCIHEKLTDLKLLDLIFWYKANVKK